MKEHRILVISNMYPSKKHPSFGIFVKNQVEMLIQNGAEVETLVIDNPHSTKKDIIKKYGFWFLKALFHLTMGFKYDIVHVHYVFPSGVIGLLFKWIWNRKLVVTVHGGDIDKMAKKSKAISAWTSCILKHADHVIAVGERLYQEVHSVYNVGENRLSLLSMGVNREVFHKMNQTVCTENSTIPDRTILFVGNIIPDKGVKEIISAFALVKKKFPDTRLCLIGANNNQEFFKELKEIIENQQIESVHFAGPLPQKEVAAWMNSADILVLPSYKEGFGLVALEAMACGTPVVGSDVGGLSYLLADECGILVPPGNFKLLSEGIMMIFENDELKRKLIRNGLIRAEKHDQHEVIKKVLNIYNSI